MPAQQTDHDVEVFFDGLCPLCMREIRMLRKLDKRGRIRFTDIAAPGFDPTVYGFAMPAMMERIRGRLPTGEMIEGVEVFRRLYAAVGYGALVRMTRIPGLSHALELGYTWFAKNRLKLTGRCHDGACEVSRPIAAAKATTGS